MPEEDGQILDLELVRLLQERQWDNIWLSPPEVLDWSQIRTFSYSLSSRQPELHDINLQTYFALALNEDSQHLDVDLLRTTHIYGIGEDATVPYAWPTYRCIYAQISYSGSLFFLSSGKWYRIADSFVAEVNEAIDSIERLDRTLPDYDDESETHYNIRIANSDLGYALMHGQMIWYGGGKSQIEFCDLLGSNGDIVHVKRYSGSRDLSHLFAQGLVSGELFQIDRGFRKEADAYLPDSLRGRFLDSRPPTDDLRVVFAIASEADEPLNLPFFSKLSLRHAASRLIGFGYKIALARIYILPQRALLKKNWRKRSKLQRRKSSRRR